VLSVSYRLVKEFFMSYSMDPPSRLRREELRRLPRWRVVLGVEGEASTRYIRALTLARALRSIAQRLEREVIVVDGADALAGDVSTSVSLVYVPEAEEGETE
jgi:hypothetical protein